MSNLVIVAIPARDEKVWKVSSEKVPHLTMLFLGEDSGDVSRLERVVEFVEHAVLTSNHGPAMLDVDERGTLGPDDADVLFFKKNYSIRWLAHLRNQLLQQDDIRTAYDSVEQYDEWTPHLTLGYPATPANEDEIPEHGLNWITFDRIAVWVEDSNGPEFKLSWPEEGWESDIAMSTINEERKALGLAAIEHHGVKGMKWGVRAQKAGAAIKSGAKKVGRGLSRAGAALADSFWQSSTANEAKHEEVHNHVAQKLDNRVERLQRSPKYRGKNLKTDSDLRKTYYQDVAKVTESAYRSAVKETYGTNFTGTKSAHYVTDARGPRIEVRDSKSGEVHAESPLTSMRDIQKHRAEAAAALHADTNTDFPDLSIELVLDDNGQIAGVGFLQPSVDHAITLGEEFLKHYGKKGMHWGIRNRKGEPVAVTPTATSNVPHGAKRKTKVEVKGGENHPAHEDAIRVAEAQAKLKKSGTAALSNHELRAVANRLQLENQVSVLTSSKGKAFVAKQLQNEGQNLTRAGVREGVKRGIAKAGAAAAVAA